MNVTASSATKTNAKASWVNVAVREGLSSSDEDGEFEDAGAEAKEGLTRKLDIEVDIDCPVIIEFKSCEQEL